MDEILSFIESVPGGRAFLETDTGDVLEAYMVIAAHNEKQFDRYVVRYEKTSNDKNATDLERKRAKRVYELVDYVNTRYRRNKVLEYLTKKIEIAERFVQVSEVEALQVAQ